MIVVLAVGEALTLKETQTAQFGVTLGAGKVLRVVHLAESGHHLADNRSTAGATVALGGRVDAVTVHVRFEVTNH